MLNEQAATERRDEGIQRAADHADRKETKWTERALESVAKLCESGQLRLQTTGEAIRAKAYAAGLTQPASERAWGYVFKVAARDGLLRMVGMGRSKASNMSLKPTWIAGRRTGALGLS